LIRMTREEAKSKAQEIVFVDYNFGDIEDGCRSRGIKVVKSRNKMEGALIEAMTNEMTTEESEG